MVDLEQPVRPHVERYRDIIPDWEAFLDALRRPLPLCLWMNNLRTTHERLAVHLQRAGVHVEPVGWQDLAFKGPPSDVAGSSMAFAAGHFHIQEEVSLLPVVLLDPQPRERILDLCAAPGNKTAQAAVAMRNSGTIVANDRNAVRMRATRGTLDRLGIINTTITTADAADYPPESGSFDRVLADVPCTCEGTSRKNHGAFRNSGRANSESLHRLQVSILTKAVQLCRPGGRIVYATCTYAPEENEMVIDATLKEFRDDLRVLPARIDGFTSSPGITRWNGRSLDPTLSHALRIWPHQNDSGGFFVAVLEKAGPPPDLANPPTPEYVVAGERRSMWVDVLHSRFGIGRRVLDAFDLHEPNTKYVAVLAKEHQTVDLPHPVSIGMPLIRIGLKYPKLTTAGARLVGPHAVRNAVAVSAPQAEAYLARSEFHLDARQAANVEGTGYVIVRREGIVLGIGLFYEDGYRVRSMFPKVLSRGVKAGSITRGGIGKSPHPSVAPEVHSAAED